MLGIKLKVVMPIECHRCLKQQSYEYTLDEENSRIDRCILYSMALEDGWDLLEHKCFCPACKKGEK